MQQGIYWKASLDWITFWLRRLILFLVNQASFFYLKLYHEYEFQPIESLYSNTLFWTEDSGNQTNCSVENLHLFIPVIGCASVIHVFQLDSISYQPSRRFRWTPWVDPWLSQLVACSSHFWCCQPSLLCLLGPTTYNCQSTNPCTGANPAQFHPHDNQTKFVQCSATELLRNVVPCWTYLVSKFVEMWLGGYQSTAIRHQSRAIAPSPTLAIMERRDTFPAPAILPNSGSAIRAEAVPSSRVLPVLHNKFGMETTRPANCQPAGTERTTTEWH